MKSKITILSVMCALICAMYIGCSTANTTAYKVASTTQVSVSTAMSLWGAYVGSQKGTSNQVSVAVESSVAAAYKNYQNAMVAVCDAGAIWSAYVSTNSAGATGAQAAFEQGVANMNQSITDLENLITSYGVKLQ